MNSHYQWSPSIRLQPLLDLARPSGAGGVPGKDAARVARHLACQAAQGGLLQASFCVGVIPSRSRAGVCIALSPFFHPPTDYYIPVCCMQSSSVLLSLLISNLHALKEHYITGCHDSGFQKDEAHVAWQGGT